MTAGGPDGWNVAAYEAFHDLRLRPALDLLARVPADLPDGPVIDLGCGGGPAAGPLRIRFPDAPMIGVDASPDMLAKARARGGYDRLVAADIAAWSPEAPPALIFSNAALHWIGDHEALIPRLYAALAPGGVLAVQMPGQLSRPSHVTMIAAAAEVRPDLFTDWRPFPGPLALSAYANLVGDEVDLWESAYLQRLPPAADGGHPVRAFSSSTAGRPVLSQLNKGERAHFARVWDAGLERAYPREDDGDVWFPFRRLFLVARRPR